MSGIEGFPSAKDISRRQSSGTTSCWLQPASFKDTHIFALASHTANCCYSSSFPKNFHVSSLVPFTSFFPCPHRKKGRCVTTATGNSHFHSQKKELDPCTAQENQGESLALGKRQTRKTQKQLFAIMYQVLILDIAHLMQRELSIYTAPTFYLRKKKGL